MAEIETFILLPWQLIYPSNHTHQSYNRILIWCEFCSFTRTTIKIPLKFPAFTFNKPKGWSISALNTETNSAAFIMRWWGGGGGADHLNSAIHQGGSEKFYSYSRGIRKIDKTWKISKGPLPVKNDTSLIAVFVSKAKVKLTHIVGPTWRHSWSHNVVGGGQTFQLAVFNNLW